MIENHKICTDFYGSLRICIVLSDFLFGVKGRIGEVTLPRNSLSSPIRGMLIRFQLNVASCPAELLA